MKLYAIGIQQPPHKVVEGESKTTREEFSKTDTLAGAWVRAYLQAWSTRSKLSGRR
jgi:hypothetical protein